MTAMTQLITRNSDQGKAWPLRAPDAREVEDDIQQLTPTREKYSRIGKTNA